jgi:hypothetical protein
MRSALGRWGGFSTMCSIPRTSSIFSLVRSFVGLIHCLPRPPGAGLLEARRSASAGWGFLKYPACANVASCRRGTAITAWRSSGGSV